ncbi:hypothetical protein KQI82_08520 [Oscillibacter sp. MSJ-2]|uniref:MarR family transcriptional regulator n=1 Tax=Dysosmobacter acutus TaxID=2841504 RepID=A0ABS6FC37_9FIRM|nr:helix-turn-helix domain-containing protein [Dysosmobacter acutus]MBU5626950.1 hypothetical protein [Dysosmobacter acutus]
MKRHNGMDSGRRDMGMAVKDQILEVLDQCPGLTDTELEKRLQKRHQQINSACNALYKEGRILRRRNPDKNMCFCNYPAQLSGLAPSPREKQPEGAKERGRDFDEDAVKAFVKNWLERQGWDVSVAWGKAHGVDIEAKKDGGRWLIEVKGPGSRQAMRHNYFLSIIGETLYRMDDEKARYSIAFPDMPVYRGLWRRLPELAKRRTGIDLLLVDEDGGISVLK